MISADPEAMMLIGFEESAQILTGLFEGGFTVDAGKRFFFVDGNLGDAMGEQLPAGSLTGQMGTTPASPGVSDEFKQELLGIDPELTEPFNYGPETYDAIDHHGAGRHRRRFGQPGADRCAHQRDHP